MKAFHRFFVFLFLAGAAQAAVLVKYDFNGFAAGTSATTAYSPTLLSGAYVQSMSIQDPESYVHTASGYISPWDGNLLRGTIRRNPATGIYVVDDATAVQRAAYFSITYTPTAATSFTSITLDAAASGGDVAGMVLRSSLTGLTVNDGIGSALIGTDIQTGEQQQIHFDLSGISALQNVTDPVTFYFYMNTSGSTGSVPFYIDNLTLNGDAVPEPAAAGLLAIGGVSLLIRRRRAQRSS